MRVVHYLNQFYGRLGGEEAADAPLEVRDAAVGPGTRLGELLAGAGATLVGTVICGDNHAAEQPEVFGPALAEALRQLRPDVVVAGPAFNAGRYGLACGEACRQAAQLGLPAVTAMYAENPGVDLYRRDVTILPTTATAAGMNDVLGRLATAAVRLGRGESLGAPWEGGYLSHGIRRVQLHAASAAERGLDMLAARLTGAAFETEIPLPAVERVKPAAPVADLLRSTIAVVTTSALVPKGNPDRMRQSYSTEWRTYPLAGLSHLDPGVWESIHGGFDTSAVNRDPHQVVPLDVLRAMEGTRFGSLHPSYYVTAGVGTPVSSARRMGSEIAADLLAAGVKGVLLTAT